VNASEIRDKNDTELREMLEQRYNDLNVFRIQLTTGVVDNVRAARTARRDIARIKTVQRERALSATKGTE
jgi:large subunit ribosomal protein L29